MKIALILFKYGVPIDDPCCFPLGFMYVSSWLKKSGQDVKVLNFNLFDYDIEKELDGITDVYMTGFEEFKQDIIKTSALCKKMGIRTHLGGALATFATEEMCTHVNHIYAGEYDGKVNIDSVPWPDYEGFGIREYHKRNGIKHIGVLTSRGCPFSCTFCAHTCKYRERDLKLVQQEIEHYLTEYSPDIVVFNDNTLNVKKSRFLEICSMMNKADISWSAAIRVDVFDEEMAVAAKEGNCKSFVVGVESFIQHKLNQMDKKTTVNQIKTCLDLLNKYKIPYHGNILTGFPNETVDDIVKEIEDIPKQYNVFPVLVQPFVGTSYNVRSITYRDVSILEDMFTHYAEQKGMNVYKEIG